MLLTFIANLLTGSPVIGGDYGTHYVGRQVFPPKLQGATVNYAFDFTSGLSAGETLTGGQSVLAFVWSGVDGSPSSILSGGATISGNKVNQVITAGVVGVMYGLKATVTTSLGQILQMTAYLTVISDLP